jgi:nucleolar protein 4
LNGHEVGGTAAPTERKGDKKAGRGGKDKGRKADVSGPIVGEKKKRLVVEFAIENAQVVARRKEKEEKARERSKLVSEGKAKPLDSTKEKKQKYAVKGKTAGRDSGRKGLNGGKRKREEKMSGARAEDANKKAKKDEETAKTARIIARKRQIKRRAGKGNP